MTTASPFVGLLAIPDTLLAMTVAARPTPTRRWDSQPPRAPRGVRGLLRVAGVERYQPGMPES
jgi:hypothetical protein